MKRRYTATGVKAQPAHLSVYVTIEVGTSVRFVCVNVPWGLLADRYREVADGIERECAARLEAEAEVLYLPLESWE